MKYVKLQHITVGDPGGQDKHIKKKGIVMQISTKFTIAVHILTAVEYFSEDYKVTSDFLASSIGSNPVIIRNIMSQLKKAGLLKVKRGTGGTAVSRPLEQITFLDIYNAVETNSNENLFRFHENPNPECPVGRNIHYALDDKLEAIQSAFEQELSRHTLADVYTSTVEAVRKQEA